MRPLAVVGNVNVDLILGPTAPWPQPGTEVLVADDDLRVGGAAGNTALAWAGLGADYTLAASVGDDVLGHWLAEAFGDRATGWPVHPTRTTVSVGLTHPGDERTFFTTTGHLPELTWADTRQQLDRAELQGGILLVCGCFVMPGLSRSYPALFDWARDRDIAVALDPGWPPDGWTSAVRKQVEDWVRETSHLLINEIEAIGLTGAASMQEALAALAAMLPSTGVAIVKCGAGGAVMMGPDGMLRVPSPVVAVIDTIGAGDVFNAGYLMSVARGLPTTVAVRAGIAAASRAVSTRPRSYSAPAADAAT